MDKKYNYELVSLDQSLWSKTKLFFFGIQTLVTHGRYFSSKKALEQQELLRKQGIFVLIIDLAKERQVIK